MEPIAVITTPQESVNDDYLTVVKLHVKSGDSIKKGQLLIELESSKATSEMYSDYEGYIQVNCREGTEVKIGTDLFLVFNNKEDVKGSSAGTATPNIPKGKAANKTYSTVFSDKAKELVSMNNLDTNLFSHLSHVTSQDVLNVTGTPPKKESNKEGGRKPEISLGTVETNKLPFEETPVAQTKKREISYLQSVNASGLVSLLTTSIRTNDFPGKIAGVQKIIKATPLPLFIYEISRLLDKYPMLNSYYYNDKIRKYKNINVGFAIDIGKGLKVVNIPNTNNLSVLQIESSIANLTYKYLKDKLAKEDLVNATFTISDLFATSIESFHPLVNVSNSAILGIGCLVDNRFDIVLSFDHRCTTGKEVSQFLTDLKSKIESHLQ